jgi:hypothetical protein
MSLAIPNEKASNSTTAHAAGALGIISLFYSHSHGGHGAQLTGSPASIRRTIGTELLPAMLLFK